MIAINLLGEFNTLYVMEPENKLNDDEQQNQVNDEDQQNQVNDEDQQNQVNDEDQQNQVNDEDQLKHVYDEEQQNQVNNVEPHAGSSGEIVLANSVVQQPVAKAGEYSTLIYLCYVIKKRGTFDHVVHNCRAQ